jgi:hypothetical protein
MTLRVIHNFAHLFDIGLFEWQACLMTAGNLIPTSQALAQVSAALGRLDSDRSALSPLARLECAKLARELAGRMDALASLLLAEADHAQASLRATGTPTSSWLGVGQNLSKREAASSLHRARELANHPIVGKAATAGNLGAGQVRAITRVLEGLAPQLDQSQQLAAEQVMVGLAHTMDADQLSKAAGQVLRQVAPPVAEELLETRLQRQAEAAHQARSLRFLREGASVRFDGSLPQLEAESWMALLDAHAESQRRSIIEARDPFAPTLTPEQRRADALIAMINRHEVTKQAPASGGDRPRVVVKLNYDQLHRDAAGAGLISDDATLSAGELRRICCEAELIPAVLGGASEILDVGRTHRLVTPAIRTAITLRDGGCIFPGCQTRPAICEAHHLQPWWDGGETSVSNLVLLCHHHHALVEPAKHATRDQWHVQLGSDGIPEAIPPRRYDLQRKPIRHQRLRSPAASPADAAPEESPPHQPACGGACSPPGKQTAA